MGLFIVVSVDESRCDAGQLARLAEVCPVNIFSLVEGHITTDPENEDECTLCGLCLAACPAGAVNIRRLYLEAAR